MTLVQDLEVGLPGTPGPAGLQLYQYAAGFARVLDRIIAKIPEHLAQVARVHSNFDTGLRPRHRQFAFLQFQCARELLGEVPEPRFEFEPFRAAGLAPGELQHVFDDHADALGVGPDDLGQPQVVVAQRVGFGQQLTGVAHCPDRVADFMGDARAQPA